MCEDGDINGNVIVSIEDNMKEIENQIINDVNAQSIINVLEFNNDRPLYVGQVGDIYKLKSGKYYLITCNNANSKYMLLDLKTGKLLRISYSSIEDMYGDYEKYIEMIVYNSSYNVVIEY